MNDLSRHVSMDDPRLYKFERSSGLPHGYFGRPKVLTPDAWVCVALAVGFIALLCL